MKCVLCENSAIGLFTWGLYPNGDHNKRVAFCKQDVDNLWGKIRGSVGAGLMHFQAENVKDSEPEKKEAGG